MSGHTITPKWPRELRPSHWGFFWYHLNSLLLLFYLEIVAGPGSQARMGSKCTWAPRWPKKRGLSSPHRRPHNTDWCTLWRKEKGSLFIYIFMDPLHLFTPKHHFQSGEIKAEKDVFAVYTNKTPDTGVSTCVRSRCPLSVWAGFYLIVKLNKTTQHLSACLHAANLQIITDNIRIAPVWHLLQYLFLIAIYLLYVLSICKNMFQWVFLRFLIAKLMKRTNNFKEQTLRDCGQINLR